MQRHALLKQLGQRIQSERKRLGLSQEEFAARADLDRTYISGLERGVRNPSLTAVEKAAAGLGLSLAELLDGVEPARPTKGRP